MNILVVCAHPDDETIGMGGTLKKLSKDHIVTVLFVSEGITARRKSGFVNNPVYDVSDEEMEKEAGKTKSHFEYLKEANPIVFLVYKDGVCSHYLESLEEAEKLKLDGYDFEEIRYNSLMQIYDEERQAEKDKIRNLKQSKKDIIEAWSRIIKAAGVPLLYFFTAWALNYSFKLVEWPVVILVAAFYACVFSHALMILNSVLIMFVGMGGGLVFLIDYLGIYSGLYMAAVSFFIPFKSSNMGEWCVTFETDRNA